jgi:putative toxin-antitoxin system antitoxin component (TIGR02293 family)
MKRNLALTAALEPSEVALDSGPQRSGAETLAAVWSRALALVARGQRVRVSSDQLKRHWRPEFSPEEIEATVAPKRTLARRASAGELLTVEESDRALRLARLSAEAARVFAEPDKARRWLRKPNRALNGQTPLSLARTESGAHLVEELLLQIDHGVFA